jgi:hypothetical protein
MSDSDSECGEVKTRPVSAEESKLQSSIESFGSNSYYYAHSRSKEFVIPDNAIVTTGPGIITGGTPVKLSEGAMSSPTEVSRRIEKYSWCEEGDRVQVLIDDPQIIPLLEDASRVTCDFDQHGVQVIVRESERLRFTLDLSNLSEEINPSESSFRVTIGKRVTVNLKKKKGDQKWYSLRKK